MKWKFEVQGNLGCKDQNTCFNISAKMLQPDKLWTQICVSEGILSKQKIHWWFTDLTVHSEEMLFLSLLFF